MLPVQPAYISGFKYSSIAVSYNTEAINKELGVKAFSKDTSSYVIYANGDIVLKSEGSMDIGGNIFYHLKKMRIFPVSHWMVFYEKCKEFRCRRNGIQA